ncbi:hypothetical protein B0H14DRAFT_2632894 [Mycena olivaceomarginata]|nr:hypothetical protein B0H14DRAFT_2632894 [Mycena olivaceomarginata]
MDWIWSKYIISPDPASGMQSLYQTCSALSQHVLTPSDIVLSGSSFTLQPELTMIIADVIPLLGQLLNLVMQDSGLPGIQHFCHAELQILTCTTGLDIAMQSQVVRNWIHLLDNLYIAMVDLKCLRDGRPIYILGCERPSQMRQIIMLLPPSLRVKLPADFLHLYGILVQPPPANARETEHQHIRHLDHHAQMCTDMSDIVLQQEYGDWHIRSYSRSPADGVETGGLANLQAPHRAAHNHTAAVPDRVSYTHTSLSLSYTQGGSSLFASKRVWPQHLNGRSSYGVPPRPDFRMVVILMCCKNHEQKVAE